MQGMDVESPSSAQDVHKLKVSQANGHTEMAGLKSTVVERELVREHAGYALATSSQVRTQLAVANTSTLVHRMR